MSHATIECLHCAFSLTSMHSHLPPCTLPCLPPCTLPCHYALLLASLNSRLPLLCTLACHYYALSLATIHFPLPLYTLHCHIYSPLLFCSSTTIRLPALPLLSVPTPALPLLTLPLLSVQHLPCLYSQFDVPIIVNSNVAHPKPKPNRYDVVA